jgi:hypothetical protein
LQTSEVLVIQLPKSRNRGHCLTHTVVSAGGLEPVHVVMGQTRVRGSTDFANPAATGKLFPNRIEKLHSHKMKRTASLGYHTVEDSTSRLPHCGGQQV